MSGPRILLVVGGGIAAYKSCELVRLIRKAGGEVTCVMTEAAQQFVTPMALAALSENRVYTSLFDLKDEVEMGHIQLSREADLIVVCPATADLLAKMAAGIADDLATTLILATDKPVLAIPAMNVRMWEHGTTQRNTQWLREAGVAVMDPDEGAMACGEFGAGRMPEPVDILARIASELDLEVDLPALAPAPAPQLQPPAVEAAPQTDTDSQPDGDPDFVDDSGDDAETAGVVEALEPEPEVQPRGGLGSLLSAIIPRSTSRRSHEEIDAELEAELEAMPEVDPFDAEGFLGAPSLDPAEEESLPDPGAPLLAAKGKASSAPPTDPDAIGRDTARHNAPAMAQPVAEDRLQTAAPEPEAADPLAGQAEFDPDPTHRPLHGAHVLVTAGPTWEPIDPVRYIANRSSGKQGFAIAAMAAAAGARVTLVAGPVHLPTPLGVDRIDVESAAEMAEAVRKALPADIAFMVAAVADWKSKHFSSEKMKKRGSAPPALILTENPDILATTSAARKRPRLLIGFAAETENVVDNAKAKRKRKGADWIIANDVSHEAGGGVMGGETNEVHIVTSGGVEKLPEMSKGDVARELVRRAARVYAGEDISDDD